MFNFGPSELVVLLLLVVIVFGPYRLPDLRDRMVEARPRRRRLAGSQRWAPSEWLLVAALVLLTAVVLGNAVLSTGPRR